MDVAAISRELAASVAASPSALAGLDAALEDHLRVLDEVSALMDANRLEVSGLLEEHYPQLRSNASELVALFAAIDATEAAVGRVSSAARMAADRLDALTRGADQKGGGEGLKKIAQWLGARPRAPLDAPVVLPPFEPSCLVIDAAAELAGIAAVIAEVPVRRVPAKPEGEGDGAVESIAAPDVDIAADTVATRAAAAPPQGVAVAAAATAVRSTVAAAGEGDDEED